MRIDSEKSPGRRRWSIETSASIDRAVAALLVVAVLGLAQLLGVTAEVLRAIVQVA
ncbi:MAG TPA: hypothetical protein VIJ51_05770 [Solirubrobacteraceae bacterium]